MLKKRWIALGGCLVATTAVWSWAATTYQLQTKLANVGGTINVRGTQQTAVGTVYKNYTTSADVPVSVQAKDGYYITSLTRNGVSVITPDLKTPDMSKVDYSTTFNKTSGTLQSLVATFAAKAIGVTSSVTSNTGDAAGLVSPASTSVASGSNLTLTAVPSLTNGYVSAVTVNGATYSLDKSLPDVGPVQINLTGIKAATSVAVTFKTVTVNAGTNKVVGVNAPATIRGTASGIGTLAWSVVSAPKDSAVTTASISGAATSTATFTPDVLGNYLLKVTDSVNGAVLASSTVQVTAVASTTDAMGAACNGCHNPDAGAAPSNAYGNWTKSAHAEDNINCVSCHTDSAMPTPINTASVDRTTLQVQNSAAGTVDENFCNRCHHTGTTAKLFVSSQHWMTTENTDTTDHGTGPCMLKCHFKSTNAPGCATCHSGNLQADGSFTAGGDVAHNPVLPNAATSCEICHSGAKHGGTTSAFLASAHWNNHKEYGPEFAGGAVNGEINPNESWTTTEDGVLTTCSTRCHFKPNLGPNPTATDSTISYTAPDGTVYTRPGKDACVACHDPHKPEATATARNTCYTCHSGGNHGKTTANFEKSTHNTGAHANLYYQMGSKSCVACHDPHSTKAAFVVYSSHVAGAPTVAAAGCQQCHAAGSAYGVINVDGTLKAPHDVTTANSWDVDSKAGYMATGAKCGDCHGHNNTINAGWAEGAHGDVTAVPWKGDADHKDWGAQGTTGTSFQADPTVTNCIRCHSSVGFAKFVDSNFTNIDKLAANEKAAPLTCGGCHVNRKLGETQYSTNEGALRLSNFTSASNGTKGYKAVWGYNFKATSTKVATTVQLLDNRNSNLCMPCHSQRASGQEIKDFFAKGSFKQYSAGSQIYPHAAQPAAIWSGKGGYEFSSAATYQDRMNHQRIGNGYNGASKGTYTISGTGYNGTGITQGSCVGCHYTPDAKYGIGTHSLEAVKFNDFSSAIGKVTSARIVSTECAKCHPSDFTVQDIAAKKADFDAAVAALGNLLVKKGITLDGVNPLPERTAFDMSLGTKDNVVAEKNMGAWFNWYLFSTSDKAAYVHNPAYARRLVFDSIDWLDDNTMNGSSAASILALAPAAGGSALTTEQANNAIAYTNDPGCMGCHYGTNTASTAAPGVEQAPHFTAAPNAQFVAANLQCNNCHGIGHGTDSPGGTILADFAASGHADVNAAAFSGDENFKTQDSCNVCHTATGYSKYVNSKFTDAAKWGKAGDNTNEIIACNACHTSTAWKSSVRAFDTYSAPYGGFGAAAKQKIGISAGGSNLCVVCHAARENGFTVGKVADFTNASFKNPHYLGAAGVMYKTAGFNYYDDPAKYANPSYYKHDKLGMNNYSSVSLTAGVRKMDFSVATGSFGPCVACHMNNDKNVNGKSHTLSVENLITSMPSSNGALVTNGALGQSGCYGCHASTTKTILATIEEEKTNFGAALDFLKAMLASKGIYFDNNAYPYVYSDAAKTLPLKNWTVVGPTTDGKLNMGAAFNMKLLAAEPGAFAHNRVYTKRLLFDSIDYMQNGAVTGSISFSSYSSATTPVSAARTYLGTARP